jgi:hypothetical protein
MRYLLLLAVSCLGIQAQGPFTLGFRAGADSWDANFGSLPGWGTRLHPRGGIDFTFQPTSWKVGLFAGLDGDPHRSGEASSIDFGLRGDILKHGRHAFTGLASVGLFKGPNWSEYGCTYEWPYCHITGPPEECWWATVTMGLGWRINISPHWALEPITVEYPSPYGIGPRWRFSTGFRIRP